MKTVLVTGAAGFIAHHVIEGLLRAGVNVVGVDNFDPFYGRWIKEKNLHDLSRTAMTTLANFRFEELDLARLDPHHTFGRGRISAIIHLAAKAGVQPSLADPAGYFRANVTGTQRVLEFARQNQISQLVFASSSSVYGNRARAPFSEIEPFPSPVSPYGTTKLMGEELISGYATAYGIRAACLRLFTVYGPRQRPDLAIHKFTRSILNHDEIVIRGDGSTRRDYTFVTDIRDGILAALDWTERQAAATCEIFNIGASGTITVTDLIALLERILRMNALKAWAPLPASEMVVTHADVSKAKRELGYSPQVDVHSGVRKFVEWYLQEETNSARHAA